MSLVEVGRYGRNLAHIIVGRLEAEGIPAVAFDAATSFTDSDWLIPVRVMVDEEDLAAARALVAD